MPQRAILRITTRFAVTLVVLAVAACNDDASAPVGTYASTCDAGATIDFQSGGVAAVNRNFCEGYGPELWDYAIDGDTLTMAPQGRLGDPSFVQETFEISGPSELTLTSDTSFVTCGNCKRGDTWVKQ